MKQWDAGAEQHRLDVEPDFVDKPRLEKVFQYVAVTAAASLLQRSQSVEWSFRAK